MNTRLLMWVAAFALAASRAIAGGIDLSYGGCPGNVGALAGYESIVDCYPYRCGPDTPAEFFGPQVIDCASGGPIVVLGTWSPNESIPDLSNLDGRLRVFVPGSSGADFTQAPFWDFGADACNGSALTSWQRRPATGCSNPSYIDTWNVAGAGTSIAFQRDSDTSGRMAFTCYRPSGLSVAAGQRLFGVQIIIDGSTSTEAGGRCAGCCSSGGIGFEWYEGDPGSFGATTPTNLYTPTGTLDFTNAIGLFPNPTICAAVPTLPRSWGRLKQLYR